MNEEKVDGAIHLLRNLTKMIGMYMRLAIIGDCIFIQNYAFHNPKVAPL